MWNRPKAQLDHHERRLFTRQQVAGLQGRAIFSSSSSFDNTCRLSVTCPGFPVICITQTAPGDVGRTPPASTLTQSLKYSPGRLVSSHQVGRLPTGRHDRFAHCVSRVAALVVVVSGLQITTTTTFNFNYNSLFTWLRRRRRQHSHCHRWMQRLHSSFLARMRKFQIKSKISSTFCSFYCLIVAILIIRRLKIYSPFHHHRRHYKNNNNLFSFSFSRLDLHI